MAVQQKLGKIINLHNIIIISSMNAFIQSIHVPYHMYKYIYRCASH